MKIFLLVLFEFILQSRIIAGWDADIKDYPYQAGLSIDGKSWCEGSLISRTCVLTAAHCVDDDPVNIIRVYFGSSKKRRGTLRLARSWIVHPQYQSGTRFNDIACLKFDPIEYTNEVRSVVMASGNNSYQGLAVIASGYGKISDDSTVSNDLQAAELRVISNSECANTFSSIEPTKLCANPKPGTNMSICQGASGGPLVLKDKGLLVGVSSFTDSKSCEQGLPSGYVRVTSYRKWVTDNCGCGV